MFFQNSRNPDIGYPYFKQNLDILYQDIWISMKYRYLEFQKYGYPTYGYLDFHRNLDILNMDIRIFPRSGYPDF